MTKRKELIIVRPNYRALFAFTFLALFGVLNFIISFFKTGILFTSLFDVMLFFLALVALLFSIWVIIKLEPHSRRWYLGGIVFAIAFIFIRVNTSLDLFLTILLVSIILLVFVFTYYRKRFKHLIEKRNREVKRLLAKDKQHPPNFLFRMFDLRWKR